MKFNQKTVLLAISLAVIGASLDAAAKRGRDSNSGSSSDEEETQQSVVTNAQLGQAVREARLRQRTAGSGMTTEELARTRAHEEREVLLLQQRQQQAEAARAAGAPVSASASAAVEVEDVAVAAPAPANTTSLNSLDAALLPAIGGFLDHKSLAAFSCSSKAHKNVLLETVKQRIVWPREIPVQAFKKDIIARYIQYAPVTDPVARALQDAHASSETVTAAANIAGRTVHPYEAELLRHRAVLLVAHEQRIAAANDRLQIAAFGSADVNLEEAVAALTNGANIPFCGTFYGGRFRPHGTGIAPEFAQIVEHVIKTGNVDVMKSICDKNIPVNAMLKPLPLETLLEVAVCAGQPAIVQMLINRGEDIHEVVSGETLLIRAAAYGNQLIVDLSLRAGLSLEQVDRHGRTPLVFAISNKDIAMIEFLLSRGANINATEGRILSQTPLDRIIYDNIHNNHPSVPEIEELLRSRGALTNRELLAPADRATFDLREAINNNNAEQAKQALAAGANVNFSACCGDGNSYGTMLAHAVRLHNVALVDVLIAHGADVNVSYVLDDNVRPEFIRNGLYHDANVCNAPLIAATRAYLGKEASEIEPTPAQRAERLAIFERIFAVPGLDINRRSTTCYSYGKTIIQELYETRNWLRFDDEKFKDILLRWLQIPGIDCGLIITVRLGDDIPAPYSSLLHQRFLYGTMPEEIVFAKQVFSIPGLNINIQNSRGFTPLMVAVLSQNSDLVQYLLSRGADITLTTTDAEKETALDWARSRLASVTSHPDENADAQAASIASYRAIIAILEAAHAALAPVAVSAPAEDVEAEPAA